jgi:hypothetical protein
MRASERAIVFGVVLAALAIGFYVLVLGPQRDKASELSKQVDDLHASISREQQVADFAEQARREFPRYYGRLVVLGKAVPEQADTASMLVQLNSISNRSQVAFQGISLSQGSDSAGTGTSSSSSATTTPPTSSATPTTPTAPASTGTSGAAPSTTASGTSGSAAPVSATPAPATEASAATLPIGAVVGPGGLPTLPYDLTFRGTFFDISNFIGFALNGGAPGSSPKLDANFLVTTYVTPEEQGLTAGATPSGPAAPSAPGTPQAQPASAVVSK